jgi:rhamnogalacturonan endolyase
MGPGKFRSHFGINTVMVTLRPSRSAASPLELSAFFIALLMIACRGVAANDPVALTDHGPTVSLSNGIVSFSVAKNDATIHEMTLGTSPNLVGRGAYFAVVNSGGHDSTDIHNAVYKVIQNTPALVELSFDASVGHIHFDQHYILRQGDHGFYTFVLMTHQPADPAENNGQIRWSFYLNPSLFNYQLATDTEQGPIPDTRGSTQVQDATFRLSDGTIYTKYNYCSYIEEDDVHGECGQGNGSYGAFIVMGGKEYLQAPTKQEITVHQGPIIHRFLVSGHFEPRELTKQPISGDWRKLCGPWMVYLNSGDGPAQLWADAKNQAKKEQSQWPYQWMQNADYPLERGEVTGTLKLYDGSRPAANALMVLAASSPDWQVQTLGYIFSARADAEGNFMLPHVRPGSYSLYAVVPGITDEFRQDNIIVTAGGKVDLGIIRFVPAYYSVRLWQIGSANWKTTGFKLADQPRQYGLNTQIPANLNYVIGKSTPAQDWYYAQAKPGNWNILFKIERAYSGEAVLTLGIAGQTSNPILKILANGKAVGSYMGGNSSALYRSAILGSSYHETKIIRFPVALLHPDSNTIMLSLGDRGGINYDVVKLEIDDPNIPRQIPPVETAAPK